MTDALLRHRVREYKAMGFTAQGIARTLRLPLEEVLAALRKPREARDCNDDVIEEGRRMLKSGPPPWWRKGPEAYRRCVLANFGAECEVGV